MEFWNPGGLQSKVWGGYRCTLGMGNWEHWCRLVPLVQYDPPPPPPAPLGCP